MPDIRRLSSHLTIEPAEFFRRYLLAEPCDKNGLPLLAKRDGGDCVFAEGASCVVHDARPDVCRFYFCQRAGGGAAAGNWTSSCMTQECREGLWAQSIASSVAQAYVSRVGVTFDAESYAAALASIDRNVKTSDSEHLSLARAADGSPLGVLYDCETCSCKGTAARETPLTLLDIQRIAAKKGWPVERVFRQVVDDDQSAMTGGLRARRNGCCVLRDNGSCSLDEDKPLHCRLTSCPLRSGQDALGDRLFLGAGTVGDQYEHAVATAYTRDYVAEGGTRYDRRRFRRSVAVIEATLRKRDGFDQFCDSIASCRYVDDTPAWREPGRRRGCGTP